MQCRVRPGLCRILQDEVLVRGGRASLADIQVCIFFLTVGYLSFGPIEKYFMLSVTLACARRTGAAARVERRRRER